MRWFLLAASLLSILFFGGNVHAEKWTDTELEVLERIQLHWDAVVKKDHSTFDKYLHPDFLGWTEDEPMPKDKATETRWTKHLGEQEDIKYLKLSPVGFVIAGDTAVAHYYYMMSLENTKKGERETLHGRFTDVLVKTNVGWQFIVWRGGDDQRWNKK